MHFSYYVLALVCALVGRNLPRLASLTYHNTRAHWHVLSTCCDSKSDSLEVKGRLRETSSLLVIFIHLYFDDDFYSDGELLSVD